MNKKLEWGTPEYYDAYFPFGIYKFYVVGNKKTLILCHRCSDSRKANRKLKEQYELALTEGLNIDKVGKHYIFHHKGKMAMLFVERVDSVDINKVAKKYASFAR